MISCIVPAYNEEDWIELTLRALLCAKVCCPDEVEIIVVENGSRDRTREIAKQLGVRYRYYAEASRVKAKNIGASMAKGNILAFVDADCMVSGDFLSEIAQRSKLADGGGVDHVKLIRYSLGIYCFLLVIGLILLWHQIRIGAFWVRKSTFESMGGFRHKTLDDVDFAKRLKKYNTSSLEECSILWSTRKFDKHGDWYWLKGYK